MPGSQRMHLGCTRNLNVPPMLLCAAAPRPAVAIWTRPTPDRDADFVKPSYLPTPGTTPLYQPGRREEGTPLYAPQPSEFRPAELPDRAKELPAGPKMPERRPDPIPAGMCMHMQSRGRGMAPEQGNSMGTVVSCAWNACCMYSGTSHASLQARLHSWPWHVLSLRTALCWGLATCH